MVDYYDIKQVNAQNTYHRLLKFFKHTAATKITCYTPHHNFFFLLNPGNGFVWLKSESKLTPLLRLISTCTLAVMF